jgi:hypothetical protein
LPAILAPSDNCVPQVGQLVSPTLTSQLLAPKCRPSRHSRSRSSPPDLFPTLRNQPSRWAPPVRSHTRPYTHRWRALEGTLAGPSSPSARSAASMPTGPVASGRAWRLTFGDPYRLPRSLGPFYKSRRVNRYPLSLARASTLSSRPAVRVFPPGIKRDKYQQKAAAKQA